MMMIAKKVDVADDNDDCVSDVAGVMRDGDGGCRLNDVVGDG